MNLRTIARKAVTFFDIVYFGLLAILACFEMLMPPRYEMLMEHMSISTWIAAPMYFAFLSYAILLLYTFITGALATSLYQDRRMFAECLWNPLIAIIAFLIARFIWAQSKGLQSQNLYDANTAIFMLIALVETLIRAIPPVNLRNIKSEIEERELLIGWLGNARKSYWQGIPIFVVITFMYMPFQYALSINQKLITILPFLYLGGGWILFAYILQKINIGIGRVLHPSPEAKAKGLWKSFLQTNLKSDAHYAIWSQKASLIAAGCLSFLLATLATPNMLDLTTKLLVGIFIGMEPLHLGHMPFLSFILGLTYGVIALQRLGESRRYPFFHYSLK